MSPGICFAPQKKCNLFEMIVKSIFFNQTDSRDEHNNKKAIFKNKVWIPLFRIGNDPYRCKHTHANMQRHTCRHTHTHTHTHTHKTSRL
jgi:hypothetical protein